MEVTDTEKAKAALTLIGVVFFVEVGAMLLQSLVALVAPGALGEGFWTVQSVFWMLTTGVLIYGAWSLSRAMQQSEVMMVILGGLALELLLDLFWIYQSVSAAHFRQPEWMHYGVLTVALVVNVALLYVIGKLGKTTGFAAAIGAFVAVRAMMSFGLAAAREVVMQHLWLYSVRTGLSVLVGVAIGALALHARGALSPAPAPATGGLGPVSGGAPAVVPEAGGGRLIATGLVLLVVGIAVTAASYSAASSGSGGGRYVIATGAIATGLVQLFRGLGKLGRGP